MSYNISNRAERSDAVGNAIAGLFAAGVMFVLGYTVVRASLAQSSISPAEASAAADVVVPHEGTLWADFGTRY